MTFECTLAILAARTDVGFMMHTIPHLVRTCRFPFKERIIFVDTAPLGEGYKTRPGIGTMDELYTCCEKLIQDNVIDRIIDIPYIEKERKKSYKKHFIPQINHTHDYRGYPIWGSIFPLEIINSQYLVHFDSDMFLYQKPSFNWIEEGIIFLQKYPEIVSVLPLSGPPTKNEDLIQQNHSSEEFFIDNRGFYSFKTFTSRVFLIDIYRFEKLLPLRLNLSLKSKFKDFWSKTSCLPPWEEMVGDTLRQGDCIRVDINSPHAWTLHPNIRGTQFTQALPDLIQRIEAGKYPPEQAGHYDLMLEYWT